jgi:hypothetical protein
MVGRIDQALLLAEIKTKIEIIETTILGFSPRV